MKSCSGSANSYLLTQTSVTCIAYLPSLIIRDGLLNTMDWSLEDVEETEVEGSLRETKAKYKKLNAGCFLLASNLILTRQ